MTARILLLMFVLCIVGSLYADAVSYSYDDAGRLTSVTYSNGYVVSYTCAAAGNLTARTVSGGSAYTTNLSSRSRDKHRSAFPALRLPVRPALEAER
jgi:YD repeat-containing protein